MLKDFFNHIRLVDEADDPHLSLALRTGKRVGFINFSDEVGPAFFKILGNRRRSDFDNLRLPTDVRFFFKGRREG